MTLMFVKSGGQLFLEWLSIWIYLMFPYKLDAGLHFEQKYHGKMWYYNDWLWKGEHFKGFGIQARLEASQIGYDSMP